VIEFLWLKCPSGARCRADWHRTCRGKWVAPQTDFGMRGGVGGVWAQRKSRILGAGDGIL
jgi:hypothetical protein